jgi:hypothetical protein
MIETTNLTYLYYFQIAQSMFSVLSNLMAVDDAVLEEADKYGSITKDLIQVIDSYASAAVLLQNETIEIDSVNLALVTKRVSTAVVTDFPYGLSYPPLGIRNFGSGIFSDVGNVTQVR